MDHSNLRVSEWRRRTKQRAVEYLGGKCRVCGYDKCSDALEFHHRDPKSKEFRLSKYAGGWDRLRKELDKCDLLCANCHREAHAKQREKTVEEHRRILEENRAKTRVQVICSNCQTPKLLAPCRAARSEHHFCNRKCKGEFSRKR